MNTNTKTQSITRQLLLGTLATLSLVAALASPAAAGGLAGRMDGGDSVFGSRSVTRSIGEEIPTLHGGLAGGVGGDSIVIPQ